MANYTRTIEYAFANSFTTLAASTLFTSSTLTLTIAESSVVFDSCVLVLSLDSNVTVLTTNTTRPTVTFKLGAATAQTISVEIDTSNGEEYRDASDFEMWFDVTAHFQANFGAGPTQTAVYTVNFPVALSNLTAKLIVTYHTADSNTTRTKTVRIPLEGYRGALPTSLTSIGSSEIPNLSTFLPEASVSVKDIFFEVRTAIRNPGAAFVLSVALDSEAATSLQTRNNGSWASGDIGFNRFFWKRTDMTTNATHDFKMRTGSANSCFNPTVVLVVTYTYDHSSSTRILNSLMLPMVSNFTTFSDITGSPVDLPTMEFFIEEPGTITVLQSAAQITAHYMQIATTPDTPQLKVGSQSFVSYSPPALAAFITSLSRHSLFLQLRFDSSASAGAGYSPTRGSNKFVASLQASGINTNLVRIDGGWFYLNYTSDKHAGGDGVHNRTVFWLSDQESSISGTAYNANAYSFVWGSFTPSVSDSTWCLASFASVLNTTATVYWGLTAYYSGEFQSGFMYMGAGSASIGGGVHKVTGIPTVNPCTWKRYNGDPAADRVSPFAARNWSMQVSVSTGFRSALMVMATYHAITFTFSGSVTGYSGSGSGITVKVHRADTGELVTSTTTSAGGAFSATVFDNTLNLYGEAYVDGTHVGRTGDHTAV